MGWKLPYIFRFCFSLDQHICFLPYVTVCKSHAQWCASECILGGLKNLHFYEVFWENFFPHLFYSRVWLHLFKHTHNKKNRKAFILRKRASLFICISWILKLVSNLYVHIYMCTISVNNHETVFLVNIMSEDLNSLNSLKVFGGLKKCLFHIPIRRL